LLGLSLESGGRAKLIPQDWMTDIPEKTPLVLLMRGVLLSSLMLWVTAEVDCGLDGRKAG
jgi:hypothetical protein